VSKAKSFPVAGWVASPLPEETILPASVIGTLEIVRQLKDLLLGAGYRHEKLNKVYASHKLAVL